MDARASADAAVAEYIDPREWFEAHGAKGSLDAYANSWGCASIAVGAAREDALRCTDAVEVGEGGENDLWVYRMVEHEIVRVVRAGKVVDILDVATSIHSVDAPPPPPGRESRGFVNLELDVASDGMSATVVALDPKVDCQRVHESPPEPEADYAAMARGWDKFDNKWITRICNGRGAFVWKGRRFARTR
jgi:hypothetical protein